MSKTKEELKKELINLRNSWEEDQYHIEELEKKIKRLKSFFDEVKKLSRELGRTNFITKQSIEELIVEFG